jgi:hypothetical protein
MVAKGGVSTQRYTERLLTEIDLVIALISKHFPSSLGEAETHEFAGEIEIFMESARQFRIGTSVIWGPYNCH